MELQAALGTKIMDDAINSLDGDLDQKINVDFDPI